MRSLLFAVVFTLVFSFGLNYKVSFAQEDNAAEEAEEVIEVDNTEEGSEKKEEAIKEVKKEETKEPAQAETVENSNCDCAKPAIEALSKSYISLEEDEWPLAIKLCTDTEAKITELEKTCKCPALPVYKKIAKAYLNYAKGGDILDGEEDIDCLKAKQLYDEAEKLFEEALPKVLDAKLKKEVSLISDFCLEENEFVKDECS